MYKIVVFSILVNFIFSAAYAQTSDELAEAFGVLPEIRNVRISPDGSKILMLQEMNDETIIVTKDLSNPQAQLNGIPIEEGHISSADWASNDTIVASVLGSRYVGLAISRPNNWKDNYDYYKARIPVLIKLDWAGNGSQKISKLGRLLDILEDDPDHVLVERRGRVRKLNIKTLEGELITTGPVKTFGNYRVDKDKNVRFVNSEVNSLWYMNVGEKGFYKRTANSKWENISEIQIKLGNGKDYSNVFQNRLRFAGFSNQENIIYVYAYDDDGYTAVYSYDIDKKQKIEKVASKEKHDILSAVFDKNYKLEEYYYNADKVIRVPVSERMKRMDKMLKASFPNANVNIISNSTDKNKIVILVSSPTEPGTYYVLDMNNRSLEMLGYIYQKIDVEQLSESKFVKITARDGLIIPAYLTLPNVANGKKLPTVIIPNSEVDNRARWGFNYYVQYLVSQGYAVLQVNYRGSSGYGSQMTFKGFFELGGKILEDINDSAKWMSEQGIADPGKVCILGNSEYSGYAALQTNVMDSSLYKCAIAIDPIINLKRYATENKTNYIEKKDLNLENISPYYRSSEINKPLLLIWQRVAHQREEFEQERLVEKLHKNGTEVDSFLIEDLNINNRGLILSKIGNFLKKHLQ